MADDAAKWGGLDLEVPPPFMEPIITAINDVLELIVAFLDIVLVVLEICKVFVLGLLSPILGILEALIALIESLVNDLRKAGFYFRWDEDWLNEKDWQVKLTEHLGGYSAWESRCFNWLIDSKDPNRPDFSTSSGVIGMFFYASVDVSEVIKLIKMVMGIVRFFRNYPGSGKMLQTPADVEFTFKRDFFTKEGWADMWASEDEPPTMGELTWGFAAAPANELGMAIPAFPPDACIVEISTVPDGLMLGATRQSPGATDAKRKKNSFVQAPLLDGGGPLKIYGGTRCLVGGENGMDRSKLLSGDKLDAPEKGGLWLVRNPDDPSPIHLDKWVAAENGGKGPIMQKQVVIHHNNAMNYFFPDFKYNLIYDEMPFGLKSVDNGKPVPEDEPSREVYVRIASGTDIVAGIVDAPDDSFYKRKEESAGPFGTRSEGHSGYVIQNVMNPLEPVRSRHFPAANSRSGMSRAIKVSFPSGAQKDFMKMVRVAACIALLCRGDLDPDPSKDNSEKYDGKACGFWKLSKLLLQSYGIRGAGAYSDMGAGPQSWTASKFSLATAAENICEGFQRRSGSIPDSVFEAMVQAHGKNLLFYMNESREHSLVDGTIPSFRDTAGVTGSHYFCNRENETLFDHCSTWEDGRDRFIGAHMNRMAPFNDKAKKLHYLTAEIKNTPEPRGWQRGVGLGVGDSRFSTATLNANRERIPVFYGWKEALTDGMDVSEDEFLNGLMMGDTAGTRRAVCVPARNCFTKAQLDSALAILNIATLGVTDGKWIAVRPLETIMLPVEEFLEKVLHWLKTVRDGLLAIIKQILDYIRMIEARIMEIQQLIRKIQGILRMFSDFSVSADLHFLVCTGAGTQGLIAEFMKAENKPDDSPAAIGSGAVVVAGGLPLIILDLIKAIFAASEETGAGAGEDPFADPAALLAEEGA